MREICAASPIVGFKEQLALVRNQEAIREPRFFATWSFREFRCVFLDQRADPAICPQFSHDETILFILRSAADVGLFQIG